MCFVNLKKIFIFICLLNLFSTQLYSQTNTFQTGDLDRIHTMSQSARRFLEQANKETFFDSFDIIISDVKNPLTGFLSLKSQKKADQYEGILNQFFESLNNIYVLSNKLNGLGANTLSQKEFYDEVISAFSLNEVVDINLNDYSSEEKKLISEIYSNIYASIFNLIYKKHANSISNKSLVYNDLYSSFEDGYLQRLISHLFYIININENLFEHLSIDFHKKGIIYFVLKEIASNNFSIHNGSSLMQIQAASLFLKLNNKKEITPLDRTLENASIDLYSYFGTAPYETLKEISAIALYNKQNLQTYIDSSLELNPIYKEGEKELFLSLGRFEMDFNFIGQLSFEFETGENQKVDGILTSFFNEENHDLYKLNDLYLAVEQLFNTIESEETEIENNMTFSQVSELKSHIKWLIGFSNSGLNPHQLKVLQDYSLLLTNLNDSLPKTTRSLMMSDRTWDITLSTINNMATSLVRDLRLFNYQSRLLLILIKKLNKSNTDIWASKGGDLETLMMIIYQLYTDIIITKKYSLSTDLNENKQILDFLSYILLDANINIISQNDLRLQLMSSELLDNKPFNPEEIFSGAGPMSVILSASILLEHYGKDHPFWKDNKAKVDERLAEAQALVKNFSGLDSIISNLEEASLIDADWKPSSLAQVSCSTSVK